MSGGAQKTVATTLAARCRSAGATHVGKVRRVNEDALLERPELGLWLVADGVGGAKHGDWASRCAAQVFASMPAAPDAPTLLAETLVRLEEANRRILAHAGSKPGSSATTVVVLLVHSWFHTVLWAGDSRAYLLRDGVLQQLSRDHSEVQALVDAGAITADAARHHPRANVITRALGAAEEVVVDRVTGRLQAGDRFLLCTDGLTKVMDDEEIRALLSDASIDSVPASCVAAALTAGAPDNVTAIAVEIAGADRSGPRPLA